MTASRPKAAQLLVVILALLVLGSWYYYLHDDVLSETSERWYSPGTRFFGIIKPKEQGYPRHVVRDDGLLEVNMAGRHPLWELVMDAESQWEALKARQSRTLAEAVTEYNRRNGYPPPAGFDLWWEFVQKHDVKLVDEFDQINYDITPYLALSTSAFRERVETLSDPTKSYHINITNGHVDMYGPQWFNGDARQFASMLGGFSRALPDLVIHGHSDSRGDKWIGEDLRRAAAANVRAGEHFSDEDLQYFESLGRNPHKDLKNVCLPDDPVFNVTQTSNMTTFIASHLTYMSPCCNPHVHNAPPLLFSQAATPPSLIPQFVLSKHRPDSGLLLPSNLWEYHDPLLVVPHAWEERHGPGAEKLFWRGPTAGWHWSKGMPSGTWRDGAGAKLALMFGGNETQDREAEVLLEYGELVTKKFDAAWLNDQWMDVGLSGSPDHCDQDDGTCDEMRGTPIWKEAHAQRHLNRKKFVVDVDGYAWSEEFQRKLSWGNVVLKSSVYPEWNTKWLIPYYHYIPIKPDYSDVYNIMAFFLGDPETGAGGHGEIAERISRHASEFAREYWRWEDMQAYLYRLMIEYVRLGEEDRVAASFHL